MSFYLDTLTVFNNNFNRLIQKDIYEEFILRLMNLSKKIFPEQYSRIQIQSNGESDFISLTSGKKYDAKLAITTAQGSLIGSQRHDYVKWLKEVLAEEQEFFTTCYTGNYCPQNVKQLKIYQIIEENVNKCKEDEDIIIFFPYPIVLDAADADTIFVTDLLHVVWGKLTENNAITNFQTVYAIYPSADKKIAVRNLRTDIREYLESDDFNNYVLYNFF